MQSPIRNKALHIAIIVPKILGGKSIPMSDKNLLTQGPWMASPSLALNVRNKKGSSPMDAKNQQTGEKGFENR